MSNAEPQWTSAAVEQAAESMLKEWNPLLETDGEKVLAVHLAYTSAQVFQLQEALKANHGSSVAAVDLATEVRAQMATSISAVTRRLERLER
jgi:hypothetical protein